VVLPGQIYDPGKYPYDGTGGYSLSPTTQTAGVAFSATVRATDNWYNRVTSVAQAMNVITSDPYDSDYTNVSLSQGIWNANFAIYQSSMQTITAVPQQGGVTSGVSDLFYVKPGLSVKLQILAPAQVQRGGSPSGRTGSISNQTAGTPFTITVNATDAYWNTQPADNSLVRTYSGDPWADSPLGYQEKGLQGGTTTFVYTLFTATNSVTITTADQDTPLLASTNTLSFAVLPAPATKLRVLLPGETAVPGSPTGKTGAPSVRTAGTPFNVTVNATDNWFNVVPAETSLVDIETTDPWDSHPAEAALTEGAQVRQIMFVTAHSSWTVGAVDGDGPYLSSGTSAGVWTQPGTPVKLQTILPGETAVWGKSDGKSGSPNNLTAGVQFTLTVNLCDDNWNRVTTGGMPNVSLASTDVYWSTPTALTLSQGTRNFNATLLTAATYHYIRAETQLYEDGTSSIFTVESEAGYPMKLAFTTPARHLIAGTTIQFDGSGVPSSTTTVPARGGDMTITQNGDFAPAFMTVEIRDAYDNVAVSTENVVVSFSAPYSTNTYGITNPVPPDNPAWQSISGGNYANMLIPAGNTTASFYFFETAAGTVAIKAAAKTASNREFQPSQQDNFVTNAPPSYFTIHHNFTSANPLSVNTTGQLTVKVRDRYGNLASGSDVNGQYYTGTILLSHNGTSGKAILEDAISGATYYTFTQSDAGVYANLRISDQIQETLKVNVTDYATEHLPPGDPAKIVGYTNDTDRDLPVRSDGNVVTAGVIVTPEDMAPEHPLSPTKQTLREGSIYEYRTMLLQGDGETDEKPSPFPMMRLNMRTRPAGTTQTSTITQIRVDKLGTSSSSAVTELALYRDDNNNGKFDGELYSGGPSADVLVKTGEFNESEQAWYFTGLNEVITASQKNYFLTARISKTAEPGETVGLRISSYSYITTSPGTAIKVASSNFSMRTATSTIMEEEGKVYAVSEDIAAWFEVDMGTWTTLRKNNYIYQGYPFAGMLKISMWTPYFKGWLQQIRVTRIGTGSDSDIVGCAVYMDDNSAGEPSGGDGIFQPALDTRISSWTTFGAEGTALVTLNTTQLIDTTTRQFFIAYRINDSAVPGTTQGARISDANHLVLSVGNIQPTPSMISSLVSVVATTDRVNLLDFNKAAPNNFSVSSAAVQGDVNCVMARLTMGTMERTAIWRGLKIDRGNTEKKNKPSDVADIKLWRDVNGNGLLDPYIDQVVSSIDKANTFPVSLLAQPVGPADTFIKVTDITTFIPDSGLFPLVPGRLILGDGSENQEVVIYKGINVYDNTFTDIERSATPLSFSTGTVVSGQAIIRILGTLGGQELTTVPKDYFVTYDIDTLSSVSADSNLGLEIRTTNYFSLLSPDYMENRFGNIGIPPGGKSASYITKLNEFADSVICVATETLTGSNLQQNTVNQAVLMFTLETAKSEALWSGLNVHGIGAAADNDNLVEEVSSVKIWYDNNNNGIFESQYDLLIGSGAFGNIGQSLVANIPFQPQFVKTLITKTRAQTIGDSQRYFVTYDITGTAVPVEPETQESRTLGAKIVRDDSNIFVSSPNFMIPTGGYSGAFLGRLRNIIPMPDPFAPAAVYGAALSTTSIKWSWHEVAEDVSGYRIYSATGCISGDLSKTTTCWTENNLSPNTPYVRYVRTFNSYRESVNSPPVIRRTLANPPVGSHIYFISRHNLGIAWSPNGNSGYTSWGIIISTDNFKFSVAMIKNFADNHTDTFYLAAGLAAGTTYWFKVRAFNEDGIPTGYDSTVAAQTSSSPELFAADISTGSIKWEWKIVSGATYYRVYDAAAASLLANLEGNGATTWTETGLAANTPYSRYAKSGDQDGLSAASAIVTRYTLANPPTGLSISSPGIHALTLAWNANDATRFRIFCAPADDENAPVKVLEWADGITASPVTINALAPSTTYYFAVYGYNSDGIPTDSSATVKGITQDLPPTVSMVAPDQSATINRDKTTAGGVNLEVKVEMLAGAVTRQVYMDISVDPVKNPIVVDKEKITAANSKITSDIKKKIIGDTITEFVARDYATGEKFTAEFGNTVRITLSYPDADDDGFVDGTEPKIPEKSLKVHVLNETTDEWEEVGGTVDTTSNKVTVEVKHFSVYALVSVKTSSLSLEGVRIYPNPYIPAGTGANAKYRRAEGIRFEGLTDKAKIRIYNVAGELVFEKDIENTGGVYDWPAANTDGNKVASGVYIYYIINPDDGSQKAKGKLAIIK
jgi:hypothetical protein